MKTMGPGKTAQAALALILGAVMSVGLLSSIKAFPSAQPTAQQNPQPATIDILSWRPEPVEEKKTEQKNENAPLERAALETTKRKLNSKPAQPQPAAAKTEPTKTHIPKEAPKPKESMRPKEETAGKTPQKKETQPPAETTLASNCEQEAIEQTFQQPPELPTPPAPNTAYEKMDLPPENDAEHLAKEKEKTTATSKAAPSNEEDKIEGTTPRNVDVAEETSLPRPAPLFKITEMPDFLDRVPPIYPEEMRILGKTGTVKVEALIDDQGRVRKVSIRESAGEAFDRAAKAAFMASKFTPAKVNGEPVAVLLKMPVRFELK